MKLKDKRPRHSDGSFPRRQSPTRKSINHPKEEAKQEARTTKDCHLLEMFSSLLIFDAFREKLECPYPDIVNANTEGDGVEVRVVDVQVDRVDQSQHCKEDNGALVSGLRVGGFKPQDPEKDECSRKHHGHVIS